MSKFLNHAIIGNSNILACLTDKAELIRLYYPHIDYFQNIDKFQFGLMTNDAIHWFENATSKKQYYEGNILYTELQLNDVDILERDYVLPSKNILIRKLKFNKEVNLFVYSKLNSDVNRKVSGMLANNSLIQYCQDMYLSIFSEAKISNYQINNSQYAMQNGNLTPEDDIGMSDDSIILYSNVKEITIYLAFETELKKVLETTNWCREQNETLFYGSTKKYWEEYLKKYSQNAILKNLNKIKEKEIIERTILMFALLSNPKTGAVLASPDVDEHFEKCGRYGYCWPRDALFINKALTILGMKELNDKFYRVWAKKAQFDSGIFEQRYYSNGELAPSWGVQIDETASIIIGVYENGKWKKHEDLIYKATIGLMNYLTEEYISKQCFDLWEERKGKHLYSTASMYYALKLASKMLLEINYLKYKKMTTVIDQNVIEIKKAISEIFVKEGRLIRSIDSKEIDISLLCAVTPFDIFSPESEVMQKTVTLIEEKLKLDNGGYLRYENDQYIGGNAWIISSLWLALYYINCNQKEKAEKLFDWVTEHADNLNFLPEQIERNGDKTAWVCQLSWSHAMYVIVKERLML